MSKKEVKDLIKELRKLRYDVELAGDNGHWKVTQEGRYLATLPGSPSDIRTLRNVRLLLRRNGVPVGRK